MRLAFLNKQARNLEVAEQLFQQLREETAEVPGVNRGQALAAANQLAVVWRYQGRYDEAERLRLFDHLKQRQRLPFVRTRTNTQSVLVARHSYNQRGSGI